MKTYKTIFTEITNDRGYIRTTPCADNLNHYITTSAYMHDAIKNYYDKYDRWPSARWYRDNARWEKRREYY